MRYYIRHLYHLLLTIFFLLIFLNSPVFADNLVRLGKVGEWTNNYGEFNDVEEIPIVRFKTGIGQDTYEPDNDPNLIFFDTNHMIFLNEPTTKHTFYCDIDEGCDDRDWMFFCGAKDQDYMVEAQDTSGYDYFIKLSLYDLSLNPDPTEGFYLTGNNTLSFTCPKDGCYLIEAALASSYPPGGVEYILSVFTEKTSEFTSIIVQILDPNGNGIEGLDIKLTNSKKPSKHIVNGVYSIPLVGMTTTDFSLDVYLDEKHIETLIINNPTPSNVSKKIIEETFILDLSTFYYQREIELYKDDIRDPNYPYDPNSLPFGDMDPSFPPEGDFDGDQILNCDEVLIFHTKPHYPTLPFHLNKGINLYYCPYCLPSEDESSLGIISTSQILPQIYNYNPYLKTWHEASSLMANSFNAIHIIEKGKLYLDIVELDHPVLHLKGFIIHDYSQNGSDLSIEYLDADLFDTTCFCSNESTMEILSNQNLEKIEMISGKNLKKGSWEASYRFFGKLAGSDISLKPFNVYIVTRKK